MIDQYRHLNDDAASGKGVVIGIEEIATQVVRMNYGTHRLLSALARARLAVNPDDKLGRGIRELLNRGLV
jgi:hypothetical protein